MGLIQKGILRTIDTQYGGEKRPEKVLRLRDNIKTGEIKITAGT